MEYKINLLESIFLPLGISHYRMPQVSSRENMQDIQVCESHIKQ